MTENIAESIAAERERLAKDPETARIFLPNGAPPVARRALPSAGPGEDARGDPRPRRGRLLPRRGRARPSSEGQKAAGGLITRGDLARYEAKVRPALRFRFLGAEVLTTPAPSSGPVLAEMALAVESRPADRVRVAERGPSMHWLAEIEKRAFRDRNEFLGRPGLSGRRREALHRSRPRPAARRLRSTRTARRPRPSSSGSSRRSRRRRTSRWSTPPGMVVSVTTTLNDSFGNARVAPRPRLPDGTTRWTTSRRGPASRTCTASSRARPTPSPPASACCPRCARRSRSIPGRGVFAWGSPGGSTILDDELPGPARPRPALRAARGGGRRAALPPAGSARRRRARAGRVRPGVDRGARGHGPRDEDVGARPGVRTDRARARRRGAARRPVRGRRGPAAARRRSRRRSPRRERRGTLPPALPGGTRPAAARPAAAARPTRSGSSSSARPRSPSRSATWPCAARRRSAWPRPTGPPSRCAAAPRRRPPSASTPRAGCSPRRGRPPSTSSPRSSGWRAASPRSRRPGARGDRGRARRGGRRDRRRGHRGVPPHREVRRGAARRASAHVLTHCNAGRARDGRLRHGARRHPRRGRGGQADPRPRLRDPPVPPGRAADRVGALARRHPGRAHHGQHGGPLPLAGRHRGRRRRRRPHRRQRRHRQQDRHVLARRPREGERRALLRGRAR